MTTAAILARSLRRPDATNAVIADARRRQRRRRTAITLVFIVALSGGLAWKELVSGAGGGSGSLAAGTQTSAIRNPCLLLGDGVVSRTTQITIAYSVPGFHQCSWSGYPFEHQYGQQQVVVSLALMSKDQFVRSAGSSWHKTGANVRNPAHPIAHLGDGAYWISPINELAVYHGGMAIYLRGVLLATPLANEKALAQALIARLDRQQHA